MNNVLDFFKPEKESCVEGAKYKWKTRKKNIFFDVVI